MTVLSAEPLGAWISDVFGLESGQGRSPGAREVEDPGVDRQERIPNRKEGDFADWPGGQRGIGKHPLVGRLLDADQMVVREAVGAGMMVALDSLPAVLRHYVQNGDRRTQHGEEEEQQQPCSQVKPRFLPVRSVHLATVATEWRGPLL